MNRVRGQKWSRQFNTWRRGARDARGSVSSVYITYKITELHTASPNYFSFKKRKEKEKKRVSRGHLDPLLPGYDFRAGLRRVQGAHYLWKTNRRPLSYVITVRRETSLIQLSLRVSAVWFRVSAKTRKFAFNRFEDFVCAAVFSHMHVLHPNAFVYLQCPCV